MTRYVVILKPPDDHPGMVRVMGAFQSEAAAMLLCNKIRAACDERYDSLEDETPGYAYVMRLEKPRLRSARAWALRGERT